MFFYYLQLGGRSLSRNPVVTLLIILLIAVGVAGSVTTFAVLRAVSADPLPERSARLFVPQIDNRGPNRVTADREPDPDMTYRDVAALRGRRAATPQTAIYSITLSAVPADLELQPLSAKGYAVNADFFRMFAVPFEYGGAWSRESDDVGRSEVVIGHDLNRKFFRGSNSVGKEISLAGHTYRVSGVLNEWNPLPRFYAAPWVQAYAPPAQVFIPFQRALDLKVPTTGGTLCAFNYMGSGWDDLVQSECSWIAFWVELPAYADVVRFRTYLTAYAEEQRASGRFDWPANVKVYDLRQWLKYMHAVPAETRISFIVALGLLLVCTVNTVGLLLARFMRHAPDIGVRRALGASAAAIYAQYLTESGIVGLAGGLLGVLLTEFGIRGLRFVFEAKVAGIVHPDAGILSVAILLALGVSLVAAAYPVWRASRIQPAWQLKVG
jgi:putative ABC transport system permease protein